MHRKPVHGVTTEQNKACPPILLRYITPTVEYKYLGQNFQKWLVTFWCSNFRCLRSWLEKVSSENQCQLTLEIVWNFGCRTSPTLNILTHYVTRTFFLSVRNALPLSSSPFLSPSPFPLANKDATGRGKNPQRRETALPTRFLPCGNEQLAAFYFNLLWWLHSDISCCFYLNNYNKYRRKHAIHNSDSTSSSSSSSDDEERFERRKKRSRNRTLRRFVSF